MSTNLKAELDRLVKLERDSALHVAALKKAEREEREAASADIAAKHKPGIEAASRARWLVESAVRNAREALNVAEPPLPLGTVLVKWQQGYKLGSGLELAGERGVLQVLRIDDPLPLRRTWGSPGVGELVVRTLLANGKEGKTARKYHEPSPGMPGWWPEGVTPVAQEAAS